VTRSSFLIGVFASIVLAGCAQKQPSLSFAEMNDPECVFAKKHLQQSPGQLLDEYLRREAGGEFTLASNWFDSATLCPGHEEGPEVSYVSRGSRVVKLIVGRGDGRAYARVQYELVGRIEREPGNKWHFIAKKRKKTRAFRMVHTAYGWRILDSGLVNGEYLSIATAQSRVSSRRDKKALAHLD